jgi:hypothetical protein
LDFRFSPFYLLCPAAPSGPGHIATERDGGKV